MHEWSRPQVLLTIIVLVAGSLAAFFDLRSTVVDMDRRLQRIEHRLSPPATTTWPGG